MRLRSELLVTASFLLLSGSAHAQRPNGPRRPVNNPSLPPSRTWSRR